MLSPIVFLVTLAVHTLRALFRTREALLIENLALRQQVIALKKQCPRPLLDDMNRAFWVALRTAWPGWSKRLFIVNPDTVAKRIVQSRRLVRRAGRGTEKGDRGWSRR